MYMHPFEKSIAPVWTDSQVSTSIQSMSPESLDQQVVRVSAFCLIWKAVWQRLVVGREMCLYVWTKR